MIRLPVESSNIASIGYSGSSLILEVEFKSGGIYRYFPVRQETYDELMAAESKGSFLHQNIKGNYVCVKVEPVTSERTQEAQ